MRYTDNKKFNDIALRKGSKRRDGFAPQPRGEIARDIHVKPSELSEYINGRAYYPRIEFKLARHWHVSEAVLRKMLGLPPRKKDSKGRTYKHTKPRKQKRNNKLRGKK